MREMVRPTSAADINSRGSPDSPPEAASPTAPMRDPDLLLRLSGRIVKGCRLPRSLALPATRAKMTGSGSSKESSGVRLFDFDALYRCQGVPATGVRQRNRHIP